MKKIFLIPFFISIVHVSSVRGEPLKLVPLSDIFEEESEIMVLKRPFVAFNSRYHNFEPLLQESPDSRAVIPIQYEYFRQPATQFPFHQAENKNLKTAIEIPFDQTFKFQIPNDANADFQSWSADVVNSHGYSLHSWSGKGNMGSLLEWNGKQEKWNRIHAGEAYHVVLKTTLKNQKIDQKTAGPYYFNLFSESESSQQNIHIALTTLFTKSDGVQLTPEAQSILGHIFATAKKYPWPEVLLYGSSQSSRHEQKVALEKFVLNQFKFKKSEILFDVVESDQNNSEVVIRIAK